MTRHVRIPQVVVDKITAGLIEPPMIVHHRGDRIPVFAEKDLVAAGGVAPVDGPGQLVLAQS